MEDRGRRTRVVERKGHKDYARRPGRPPVERRFDGVDAWMGVLVLTWGTAFVSIKVLGRHLDPFEITWVRYLPFLIAYGVWMVWRRRDRFRQVTGTDWVRIAIAGGLGVLGYHIPLNYAMSSLTPGEPIGAATASIIVATTPLWTLLVAVGVRQERFSGKKAVGAVVAFSGVSVVILYGTQEAAEVDVVEKALVAILAPILWGLYSIVAKPLITRYGGLFVTGITMCVGSMALLPFGIQRGLAPFRGLGGIEWFWLVYLSLLATVGGYTIWNQALKRRSASEVTGYIFAIPVVATAAGVVLADERITPWFVVGGALAIGGLMLIQRARLPPPAPATATDA